MIVALPLLTSFLSGLLCGTLGYYVDKLRIATLSFTVAHAALAGAAVGMILGMDMTLTAALTAVGFASVMGTLSLKVGEAKELISMSFFSFFNALALFMIYLSNTTVLATSSVAAILWGSVLAITPFKISVLASTLLLFILYVILYKHRLDSLLFDRKLAEAEGINVHAHAFTIMLFVSVAIALTLKLTGGFLVFSLLYNPVMASIQISRKAHVQQLLSPTLGAIAATIGLLISYAIDLPVGACIAITSSIILLISAIARAIFNYALAKRAISYS